MPSNDSARVTIVAGDSLFGAGNSLALMNGTEKVSHFFPKLFPRLQDVRRSFPKSGGGRNLNWQAADQSVFVAAVDLSSDRQGGLLQKASEAGFLIDPVDYRDYFPGSAVGVGTSAGSVPAGKVYSGSDGSDDTSLDSVFRPRPTLSPRLNFLLGGIAGRQKHAPERSPSAEILVVAHHFELKDSLVELRHRGAEVGIAFYRSLMEPRWERFGLYEKDSPIRFFDLGECVEEITSLSQRRPTRSMDASRSASSHLF